MDFERDALSWINYCEFCKGLSFAEVDYVLPVGGRLIPVEVKLGASGRLRSLHAFINAAPHAFAVRLYSGPFSVDTIRTINGKLYTQINMPWYQAALVEAYVEKFALA